MKSEEIKHCNCSFDATHDDEKFMRRCIQLARNGVVHAAPNPTVGAVIVHSGCIIGEGWHHCCGQAHAEVNAVASVADKSLLAQSTIYVSLEPCSHYGKTPPCAKMLVECGFKRVVVGCIDPFAKVHGAGIAMLREAGITVDVGVCEDECRSLISHFAVSQECHRPYVILKWAQSSDGFIDKVRPFPNHVGEDLSSSRPVVISNTMTSMLVHKLRGQNSAVMVGTNTALKDNPSLTVRHWDGPNPVRVVVDIHGRLPHNLHLFDGEAKTLLYTCADNVPCGRNVECIKLPGEVETLDYILSDLYSKGLQSVIVEGGKCLIDSFVDRDLWDEARVETNLGLAIGDGVPAPRLQRSRLVESVMVSGARLDKYLPLPVLGI